MKSLQRLADRLRSSLSASGSARGAIRATCALAAVAAAALWVPSARAQTADAPVGRIEGDDISLRGEVHVVSENGHSYASLASGSQVTVRSGRARIELAAGGEIGICGPARFSLVRAGASLTLALDYGRVRARVSNPAELRIYTPQVQASPVAAVGRPDDISVGLEESGKMCVHATSGALRLEPQFGGESLLLPQGTEATLQDGQLTSLAATGRACGCDALEAKHEAATPPPNAASRVTLPTGESPAASPAPQTPEKKPPAPPPATPGEQPIWKIYMPPLVYDASAPNPANAPARGAKMPPPSAETALLFRQVFAEPTIIWRGEVEAPPKEPSAAAATKATPASPDSAAPPAKKPSFGVRVANFFRRLFGGKPKPKKSAGGSQTTAGNVSLATSYMPS